MEKFYIDLEWLMKNIRNERGETIWELYGKDGAEKLAKELLNGRLKFKVAEREITFLGEKYPILMLEIPEEVEKEILEA